MVAARDALPVPTIRRGQASARNRQGAWRYTDELVREGGPGREPDRRGPHLAVEASKHHALLSIAQSLAQPPTSAPSAVKQSNRELLTVIEVAEMTRQTPATLRWWRSVGHRGPKSFKLGRRVLYRRADVEKWLADADGS